MPPSMSKCNVTYRTKTTLSATKLSWCRDRYFSQKTFQRQNAIVHNEDPVNQVLSSAFRHHLIRIECLGVELCSQLKRHLPCMNCPGSKSNSTLQNDTSHQGSVKLQNGVPHSNDTFHERSIKVQNQVAQKRHLFPRVFEDNSRIFSSASEKKKRKKKENKKKD